MRRMIVSIASLVLLLFLLDQLYRVLHPEVNLVRASLVGATGWLALAAAWRAGWHRVRPLPGALAIFASAFLSVLLIEARWLVSRSALSALVHVAILALTFPVADALSGPGRGRGPIRSELR